MKVNELIKQLKQYPEDMEVRMADVHSYWPVAYKIETTYMSELKSLATDKKISNIVCLSTKSKKVAEIV